MTRAEEIQIILDQHGTMTGDTTEQDIERLTDELEGLQRWSGWAVQYPGKLPTIYGDKSIAALNCYPDEGGELLHLVTIHRGTV